jgi:LuxR family maltose regulon positive regulatory protein
MNGSISGDLLQTKLYVPRVRSSLVPRPRLIEKLNAGLSGKLTLISAPAGFGKTTLVSEWIADCERPFAWLSLDERDGDLTRFLTYFIVALQSLALSGAEGVESSMGTQALSMLESPQPPPTESVLTTLLNEIAAIPNEFALVLDDYHVIDTPAVDQALTFLLEHLPSQMHLVITTREDPPLPLPRLRVRGLLTELRAADLRFTVEETAVFLKQITDLELSADEIAALEKRTEGWIAGLQLAALSMQGRADIHGFIEAFAGDDRYIVDYLADEVLQRQPDHIHSFLLQTSILEHLSGSLCDAVTSQKTSTQLLIELERSNLFVIPLDDKRHWYRYHHLFADVLQAHLMEEQPAEHPILHQRASQWFEQNGLTADAVHHAFAAQDFERAARIIELAWAEMDRSRQSVTWLGWAKRLPDHLVRTRPVLSLGYAWAYLDTGEMEAANMWLQEAEHCLETKTDFVIADEEEFQYLPGSIAAARTYLALALGDMDGTIKYAQQALELFPEEEYLRRGTPGALLGLAFWSQGNLLEAQQAFADAMSSYEKAGNILFVITGAYVLADMELAQGRLRRAVSTYEEALELAQTHDDLVMRGAADLYTGLSELCLEQNDLPAAKAHLLKSKELGDEASLPRWHYRWCVAQAKIKEAEGNLDEALASLDEAERQYVRGPVPDIRSTAAMKARVWIKQGKLRNAQHWADEQELSVDDEPSYLREFDYITLARIKIAQCKNNGAECDIQEAMTLLACLLQAAEAGKRTGSKLEILVLQALAHEAVGNTSAALEHLAQALALAEPEGYIRLFVGEGSPMVALLKRVKTESNGLKRYVSQLLTAFGVEEDIHPSSLNLQPLVEPLSERELEVLQLVAQGLSNRQIAERLYLALPTVKGHNRNIYSKLQVTRRTEAVARARELGLL